MNKKQLIVLVSTIIAELLIFSFWYCFVGKIYLNFFNYFKEIFPLSIIILIIGGILIYTLRDKKKAPK